MAPYWNENWGNPSSRQNRNGIRASAAVSFAREQLAEFLNIAPQRLIFTSGATEANNLALIGHARAKAIEIGKPGHLITIATEHYAVLDPLRQLQKEGFRLTELLPDSDGLINKDQLINSFKKDTFLVSIMTANNEIGVLQPLQELSSLCKEKGIAIHSDAAQALGQIDLQPDLLGVDFMSISSHKLYGPKGIGALILKSDLPILPLQWGGGQESGLRPGTIPVPLVVGFVKAVELAKKDLTGRQKRFRLLRDRFWQGLNDQCPDLILNGSKLKRLPNNLNFSIPGISGSRLHKELRPYLSCTSGSACSRGKPSHVLLALGRSFAEAEASLRISIGRSTTSKEVDQAIDFIIKAINKVS